MSKFIARGLDLNELSVVAENGDILIDYKVLSAVTSESMVEKIKPFVHASHLTGFKYKSGFINLVENDVYFQIILYKQGLYLFSLFKQSLTDEKIVYQSSSYCNDLETQILNGA